MDVIACMEGLGDVLVEVEARDCVKDVKRKIKELHGFASESVLLLRHEGVMLEDGTAMCDTGVASGDTIEVYISAPRIAQQELALRNVPVSDDSLYAAALHNQTDDLSLLLQTGLLEIDTRSSRGLTPLMVAAHAGNTECVSLLYEAGADPRATFIGLRAIDLAKNSNHSDTVAFLETCKRAKKS
eukprot:TRINITY_DN24770_c0_g1_i1.p1 TRINITY_DN24770_c0_g1~~TRINITY_DN24770_c0_g1_i1.p1  ORF type:complete len:199 (+),score=49.65 TRINITY_DN24770_c0_g1_i1:43-597(+)